MQVNLQSLIFWWFLPTFVGYAQTFLYQLTYRAGDAKPKPGSLKYIKHRRILHLGVLAVYLLFSVYATHWELQREGTLYSSLGVPNTVDERGLASRFRRITAVLHPDKIADAQKRALAEKQYVKLKDGRDVLADSARRYAYDRLGPDIIPLDSKTHKTIQDFVQYGGYRVIYQYAATLVAVALLHYFGISTQHSFWRYLSIVGLATLHGHFLTHANPPNLFRHLNALLSLVNAPQVLPYQFMQILRQFTISIFIALSQAAALPPLPGTRPLAPSGEDSTTHNHQQINNIVNLTNRIGMDAQRLLELEVAPFTSEGATQDLASKMKEWVIQNTLRNDEKVRNAVGQHIARRRQDAPAGARGTR